MGWEAWAGALSDDGAWAAFATHDRNGVYALLDAASGAVIWQKNLDDLPASSGAVMPDSYCREVAFNHAGDCLVLGASDGRVFFMNRADGQVLASAFLGHGLIRNILFRADDSVVYVSSGDGFLYALEPNTAGVIWRAYVEAWLYTEGLVLSPDQAYLACAAKTGFGVLVRASDGQVIFESNMGSINAHCAAISPDGQTVFFSSQFRGAAFDLAGQIKWRSDLAHSAVFSPDGTYLVIGSGYSNSIKAYHSAIGTLCREAVD